MVTAEETDDERSDDDGLDDVAKRGKAFQASLRLGETSAKVKLLASRVEDEQVRKLAAGFIRPLLAGSRTRRPVLLVYGLLATSRHGAGQAQ